MAGALRGVVALDGPSGTGKTTVARMLAAELGAGFLDTGAMYRVVALSALREGVDLADADAVAALARRVQVGIGTDPGQSRVLLDGDDVAEQIRTEPVNVAVSPVSAVPEVRRLLVAGQREIIASVLGSAGGIVVDGRDIGTVVAPDAPLKVFLTASAEVRAARRTAQDSAAGRQADTEAVLASVRRRDELDTTRATSPLRAADDAEVLDTSELTIDQVVAALSELAKRRGLLGGEFVEAGR
ncbi:(d)CMP kinase [Prauserella cavernicola]|uniref:Cytidylate kinase n=1 Tax=Prauserella cavernicola TaxID=2800127 RepID=A0A934V8R1_9PSEU|nr:(d)CMP kinase [Prauserella cavernicola]MBK1788053.1 (d)CMP kinase [Prauserella cavernicola]